MTAGWAPRIRTLWRDRRDDRGFTLTELLVSMGILAVVMVLVTGAVLLASSTSARVDAAGASQQQAHQAFDRLDRQVRWASGFSTPGTVGTSDYVEWLTTSGTTPTCYELRLDRSTRLLQQRSWTQGSPRAATTWQLLASGVNATTPFTTTPAAGAFAYDRLRITVSATAGGAKRTDTATHDVTYTALNSGSGTSTAAACTEGRTS